MITRYSYLEKDSKGPSRFRKEWLVVKWKFLGIPVMVYRYEVR